MDRGAVELEPEARDHYGSRGSTQTRLAVESGMTQPAIARFEAGGAVPTIPVLERLASALDADLVVRLDPPRHRRLIAFSPSDRRAATQVGDGAQARPSGVDTTGR